MDFSANSDRFSSPLYQVPSSGSNLKSKFLPLPRRCLWTCRLRCYLASNTPINLPNGYRYLAHSTYSLPPQSDISASDWSQILDAYAKASRGVFILQVPLIGLCFAACLFIRDRGLERPKEPGEEEKEERNTAQQKSDDEAPPSEPPEKFDKGPNHGAECRGS